MTDYEEVLTRRHAGRQWSLNANDYSQLIMLDGDKKPTRAELDAAWPKVQAEITQAATDAAAARASALTKLAKLGLTADEIAALVG